VLANGVAFGYKLEKAVSGKKITLLPAAIRIAVVIVSGIQIF